MNKINKFEKTRIITARALELQNGAKAKVELTFEENKVMLEKDYIKLAEEELNQELLDLEIYR